MSPSAHQDNTVFATYMRGGTSKAVFFLEKDLPPPGRVRDEFLIRIMGSPDATQIDGMGGAKAAIIRKSTRPDADVDYTFVQVGLDEHSISYSGNCGNISAAVGPFALEHGLVESSNWMDDNQLVHIWNTGRQVMLVAHVPVDKATGRVIEKGDFSIAGCPGTAAELLMDYSKTATPENLLPSGNVVDHIECSWGPVEVTYCQVGNPIVFVRADQIQMAGNEGSEALNSDHEILQRVREVRGRFAQLLGRTKDWTKFQEESPMLPMVNVVSPSTSSPGEIQARLFLDDRCHPALAGTGAMCTTAASQIKGSVINQIVGDFGPARKAFNIQHPQGFFPVQVQVKSADAHPELSILAFGRTAREIMRGELLIPADFQDQWAGNATSAITADAESKYKSHEEAADAHKGDKSTEALIGFVQSLKRSEIPPPVEERLRQCLLDIIGVGKRGAVTAESSDHFLKGVLAVTKGFPETHFVVGTEKRFPAQYAAFLTAAFSHSLDFDDTHTGGIIHVAATVMSTALTEAQTIPDLSFDDFIVAVAAGYEVACRIAIALGANSWHRGFHNTSLAGIYGAVSVLARLRHLSDDVVRNAFGLAVSFASGSMQYLENGAWNKRLHPAKAAHDAFLVVAQAEAGVLGAALPLEGQYGLIAIHTDTPRSAIPIQGLKEHWELVDVGLKPYPGCRVTHTSVELGALVSQRKPVKSIRIVMDPIPFPMVGVSTPNKTHPQDVVDAQFSAYYQAAVAWIYGDKLGWGVYDHINDPKVVALLDKITIEQKPMDNQLATTMYAEFEDGTKAEKTLEQPKWQQPERPPTAAEVAEEFKSLSVPVIGEEKAEEIAQFVFGPTSAKVSQLLDLLK